MKLKYYLRGIGAGIIVAVLIMAIGGGAPTMSDKDVIKRAEELGMVKSGENSSTIKDQMSSAAESSQAPEGASSVEQTSEAQPEPSSVEESSQAQPEPEPAQQPETPAGDGSTVKVNVTAGMYSSAVSKLLYDAGLVSDANAFDKYLTDNGYDKLIVVGEFNIPKGATAEQIAKILTTKR